MSVYPGSPLFRDLRTTSLNYVKTTLSTSQLLALPCASIAPTLPETFQRGPTAQLWEYLKRHDNDSLMVALSFEEDTGNITHLFIWRDGRFWLQTITRTEQISSSPTMIADCKDDELPGKNEAGAKYQVRYKPFLSTFNVGRFQVCLPKEVRVHKMLGLHYTQGTGVCKD